MGKDEKQLAWKSQVRLSSCSENGRATAGRHQFGVRARDSRWEWHLLGAVGAAIKSATLYVGHPPIWATLHTHYPQYENQRYTLNFRLQYIKLYSNPHLKPLILLLQFSRRSRPSEYLQSWQTSNS